VLKDVKLEVWTRFHWLLHPGITVRFDCQLISFWHVYPRSSGYNLLLCRITFRLSICKWRNFTSNKAISYSSKREFFELRQRFNIFFIIIILSGVRLPVMWILPVTLTKLSLYTADTIGLRTLNETELCLPLRRHFHNTCASSWRGENQVSRWYFWVRELD
jgi:hypothetical protein